MSTRNRNETSASVAGGRVLRLVRDEVQEPAAADAALDPADAEAQKRRQSSSSLVRMMQAWSDAIDRDVQVILDA